MRFITGSARTPLETRGRLKKDLRLHHEFGFGLCLGLLRTNGELVGRYGLEPHTSGAGLGGELAWMTRREFRGQGFATEAGAALIRLATEELGLRKVFAETRPENLGSIRVMERLGLKLESQDERTLYYTLTEPAA